ncbi:MAG: hypothetical protein JWN48_5134 [Myxococcaceae bacterium]|nr:hypothetical protein [Myxococcaceae bacterium]
MRASWRWLALGALALGLVAAGSLLFADNAVHAVTLPSRKTMLVAYVGNEPENLAQFEHWLGRPVDGLQLHTGDLNWEDWDSSVRWQLEVWKDTERKIFWSIPIVPKGATLERAGQGEYDERYRRVARYLVDAEPGRSRIHVRTGWEFNGNWMHWNALGQPENFVRAYRHFVGAFRKVSRRFVFEWTPNIGAHGMDPELAYPGDAYVDIMGLDFYWNTEWETKDPVEAWKYMLEREYGLRWFDAFAARHKKPTAYAEWGLMADAPGYVHEAARWFATHDVVYQSYWNSDAAFRGKLSSDQYREAGKAYRAEFGAPAGPRDK